MYHYHQIATCLEGSTPPNRLAGLFARPEEPPTNLPEPADDIRRDLVERVRREIAAGTYDTSDKWEAALERLADDLE
jgi:hypothetical protein